MNYTIDSTQLTPASEVLLTESFLQGNTDAVFNSDLTQEGIHRDGIDFVLTLMINRDNVNGGESAIYDQDGLTLRASLILKEAGDFIFLNDKLMKHSVQPISRLDPAKKCSRDMLIAMFTQRPAVSS